MNNIDIFNFKGQEIRIFIINGEIWAVAKDVALLLGYVDTINAIKQHCKNACSVSDSFKGGDSPPFDLHPQTQLINEADINRLIFSSKLPQAETIRDWWFEEVLPTIRKTGSYSIDPSLAQNTLQEEFARAEKFFKDSKVYKESLELAKLFFEDNQAKITANDATKRITGTDILELMGATHLIPKPINKDELLTATELGKRLNLSTRRTNALLALVGFQTSHRDQKGRLYWELTEKGEKYGIYLDTGKKQSDGKPIRQIKWHSETIKQLKAVW